MYHSDSTDEKLRLGCLSGNQRARALFYQRYYGKLVGIPMRYTRNKDEANQVLNQAFLRIFQSLEQYREEGLFEKWLSTIVFRTTMSYLRSRKDDHLTVSIDERPHDPPTTGGVEEAHDVEEILAHLRQLPAALRSVFNLYVVDDFSHKEIAKILGITVENSRWRLNQARKKLQASIVAQQEKTA